MCRVAARRGVPSSSAIAAMQSTAVDLLAAGFDPMSGAGRLDCAAAGRVATGRAQPPVVTRVASGTRCARSAICRTRSSTRAAYGAGDSRVSHAAPRRRRAVRGARSAAAARASLAARSVRRQRGSARSSSGRTIRLVLLQRRRARYARASLRSGRPSAASAALRSAPATVRRDSPQPNPRPDARGSRRGGSGHGPRACRWSRPDGPRPRRAPSCVPRRPPPP
jgi:hypothetical protein